MFLALYFCIEIPSGLQGTMIRVFKLSAKEYNLLFSAYTWPDIALSIVGGILIDRVVGLRAGFLIVTVIAILGQGLMTVGAFVNNYYVIVAGRFVMGCGIGSLKSVGNVLLAVWFKKKEVTFAMSLTNGSCRLGASLGLLFPQMIYDKLDFTRSTLQGNYYQVGLTFLVGFLFLFSSLLACILVLFLDSKSGRKPLKKRKFVSKDLKDFSPKYWMSVFSLGVFYAAIYLFVANGQLFFTSKFGMSTKEANTAGFLVFAAPILLTPVMGFLIQVLGYNVYWSIGGALAGIIAHVVFNVSSSDSSIFLPYATACLISLAYSLFATSMYVVPSFIVSEHQLTTAYNVYNILYSLMFTGSSVIVGSIIDHAGFMWLEVFYTFMYGTILFLVGCMIVMDNVSKRQDQKVNKPGSWLREQLWKWKLGKSRNDHDVIEDEFLFVYNYND